MSAFVGLRRAGAGLDRYPAPWHHVAACAHQPLCAPTPCCAAATAAPLRNMKAHDRKVRKARGKFNRDLAERLKALTPKYKLDHLVKERWVAGGALFGLPWVV